ncbi:MAG: AbrB/MazE/SpoVT family DNA-binding domain-containing protein [Archaeoglobaceae archaeon]
MALVTKKYQITIPRKVREDLNIRAGEEVIFLKTRDGYKLVKAADVIEEGLELFKDIEETVEEMKSGLGEGIDQ